MTDNPDKAVDMLATTQSYLAAAAGRARAVDQRGATVKQISILASLLISMGEDADAIGCGPLSTGAVLTSKAASDWIDKYLTLLRAMPKRSISVNVTGDLLPVVKMLATARAANVKHPRISFPEHDVRLGHAGPFARFPGSVHVTSDDGYARSEFFGRILTDGIFEAEPSAPPEVTAFIDTLSIDPEAAIQASGKATGVCPFCGRPLTSPRPPTAGYDSVCAATYGLA